MENKNAKACCSCKTKKNELEKEVMEANKELNADAPFADVDPEAADMPASVVKDL